MPMKMLAPLVVIASLRLTIPGVLIWRELFAPPKLRAPVVMSPTAESAIAPPFRLALLESRVARLVSMVVPLKLISPPDVVIEMGELALI